MKLLRVGSSAREKSVSRQLAEAFVIAWKKQCPEGEIVRRDLAATVIPAINDEWVAAARLDPTKCSPEANRILGLSDELIIELEAANVVLIGVPMYNFTISAALKGWIDQTVRPGRTVQYSAQGQ